MMMMIYINHLQNKQVSYLRTPTENLTNNFKNSLKKDQQISY